MTNKENCIPCKFREDNLKNNIWIHSPWTTKNVENFNDIDLRNGTYISVDELKSVENIFKENNNSLGKFFKPYNSVWFSRGTWLYDPYHECPNDHEAHSINRHVYLIQNPKKIWTVKTKEEFIDFCKQYNTKDNYINWDKIKKQGYYGASFDFCKVKDIGIDNQCDEKYTWFLSFDVESLCVWDFRAFDKLYPCYIYSEDRIIYKINPHEINSKINSSNNIINESESKTNNYDDNPENYNENNLDKNDSEIYPIDNRYNDDDYDDSCYGYNMKFIQVMIIIVMILVILIMIKNK